MRAFLLLFALVAQSFAAGSPVALRSELAPLPESISREAFAAIDRACDSLRDALGTNAAWQCANAATSLVPAAALSERNDPAPELVAALQAVERSCTKPWTREETLDAVFAVLGASFAGTNVSETIAARLVHVRPETFSVPDAALALLALDAVGADTAEGWERLAGRPLPAEPTLDSILPLALARQARAYHRTGSMEPTPDVIAYLRWLSPKLRLAFRADLPEGEEDSVGLSPETAFFTAVLASRLPSRLLIRGEGAGIPYNWRNHLANRILASQDWTPERGFGWPPDSRATTEGVLALRLVAE